MPGAVYKKANSRKSAAEGQNGRNAGGRLPGSESGSDGTKALNTRLSRLSDTAAALAAPATDREREKTPPPRLGENASQATREKGDSTTLSGSGWMVRLTPSMLVMLGMLLIVTLTFFFGFGIIIGRGSIPPGQPTQLESLLPETAGHEPESPERILPEEDLHFMANLRAEGQDASALLPTEGAEASGAGQGGGSTAAPSPGQPAAAPAQAAPDTARHDFVLQVAAFRSESQADALRLKLEDGGMRTKLVREPIASGTLFHVQLLYRGSTENFQTLRDSLPSYGIRDSFLVSKTAVP